METEEDKRLFLLDSYALIYRGYFAFMKTVRPNSHGEDTSAVMGFVNTLLDLLRKERPSHIAAVFDTAKPTFRHELFDAYKAQREATPEAIQFAVPVIKDILEAFHIPQLACEGFEADDVIGTLARKAEQQGFTTYMVTPDKDYAQLVTSRTFMYRPARMGNSIEIWDIPRVQERFGVQDPLQVRDYLGMMGDASDNIPGLPGVGEKTAKKFLAEYGTMENLLAHAGEIGGALGKKIEENKELGLLSKRLATIETDVPVAFDPKAFHLDRPDLPAVRKIFQRLELRRMMEAVYRDFGGNAPEEAPQTSSAAKENSPSDPGTSPAGQLDMFADPQGAAGDLFATLPGLVETPHRYVEVREPAELEALIGRLKKAKEFTFDTETTSLKAFDTRIVGMSFSLEKGEAYWVRLDGEPQRTKETLERFREVFEDPSIGKSGQNLKFDIEVLAGYGIRVLGALFDTMVAHYLINPESRHGMDILSEQYLHYRPMSYTEMMGREKDIRMVDPERLKEYACEDADITGQLRQVLDPMLDEKGARELFCHLETPLIPVLADMERTGVRIDTTELARLRQEFQTELAEVEARIFEQAGERFNLNSPKQLGEVLFGRLALVDKPKKTKTGQWSTSEEVLSDLAPEHPIVADILEYRSIGKLLSTYIEALPQEINPHTGRIHTSFNQTLTATGRLSSSNPNLQNIPVRTPRGQMIRRAFVASSDDYRILSADYSQIELRIIASLAGEDAMIEAFAQGQDIHRSTASRVFGVPLEEVTREQRSHAKSVNFGIIYGVSPHGLSRQTSLSRAEAAAVIDSYYRTYPKLRDYIESVKEFARTHGYVETILGRRRYLPDILSRNANVRAAAERNAINAPIQGSAADIVKRAMIDVFAALNSGGYAAKMLLQVHDELVLDVPVAELEEVGALVKEKMEAAWQGRVPLVVEVGTGANWLEAH